MNLIITASAEGACVLSIAAFSTSLRVWCVLGRSAAPRFLFCYLCFLVFGVRVGICVFWFFKNAPEATFLKNHMRALRARGVFGVRVGVCACVG